MNSNISYGQDLQGYRNANISPQVFSLLTKTTYGGTMHFQSPPFWQLMTIPFYEGLYDELSNHAK